MHPVERGMAASYGGWGPSIDRSIITSGSVKTICSVITIVSTINAIAGI